MATPRTSHGADSLRPPPFLSLSLSLSLSVWVCVCVCVCALSLSLEVCGGVWRCIVIVHRCVCACVRVPTYVCCYRCLCRCACVCPVCRGLCAGSFLLKTEGLNMKMIGEYLGKISEFNQTVLRS
eukprot:COSAG05_NODE_497_length_9246_cov_6.935343_3_plen_125_part_00